jgi:hypothetical protein
MYLKNCGYVKWIELACNKVKPVMTFCDYAGEYVGSITI